MNNNGLSRRTIIELIKKNLKEDLTYNSGRIFGSMCSIPNEFAKEMYIQSIEKNLGDSGLFPGTLKLEKEAIKVIGSLLSNNKSMGYIVSGGTEANILALWAARNSRGLKKPEVIVSNSAHFSFDKAADLLQLKLIKVGLNENYQINVQKLQRVITKNTVAIVGVAGSTDLGVIDPINELSDLALDKEIHLHVDAAFGGFVIPFMKEIGIQVPEFDFKLKGVSSITIDPHKMGLAPIPSGGILFRNPEIAQKISIKVPYLSGGETLNTTLLGTRSGASAVSVWALLKYMGRKKYRKIVKYCLELTKILADEIRRLKDAKLIIDPVTNVIGFTCPTINNRKVVSELRKRGWALSLFPRHIRIVVMPHLNKQHIHDFLVDLKSIISK